MRSPEAVAVRAGWLPPELGKVVAAIDSELDHDEIKHLAIRMGTKALAFERASLRLTPSTGAIARRTTGAHA